MLEISIEVQYDIHIFGYTGQYVVLVKGFSIQYLWNVQNSQKVATAWLYRIKPCTHVTVHLQCIYSNAAFNWKPTNK